MPWAERTFACPGCGEWFTRRAGAEAKPTCVNCGIKRSVDSMIQLHNRCGPYYERWAASMARAAERAAQLVDLARDIDGRGPPL